MANYKNYHSCPSCGKREVYEHTSPMNKCFDCKNVYCVNCSTSNQGWGQCPKCKSTKIVDPVDVVYLLCGPDWWGWQNSNRTWTTGKGWDESTYEKIN